MTSSESRIRSRILVHFDQTGSGWRERTIQTRPEALKRRKRRLGSSNEQTKFSSRISSERRMTGKESFL